MAGTWSKRVAALVYCFIALIGLCWSAQGYAYPPSSECPPSTRSISVAAGGSLYYTALESCSVFGLSGVAVQPSHGALTGVDPAHGNGTGDFTYVNNGDGATSDTFTVLDDSAGTVTFNVTITVAAPIAGAVSATVTRNTSNNAITLNLTGGTAATVSVASAASHGTATASGTTIRYTPTNGYSGADSFTYTATNAGGTSSPATVSITVAAPTIGVSPASLSAGTAGTAYSQTLTASGGTGPYTFSATGVLPGGVTLGAGGSLSGTPAAPGTYTFTVTATDNNNNTGARFYSWTINVAAPIAGAVSATVNANTSNNPITLNLSGGTAASVSVASSAAHGTATASGASISYTPTIGYSGSDSFTYTATNSTGTSSPATVTVTVVAPVIAISPTSIPNGFAGTPYAPQTLTASGGTAPYTYSISAGALPGGVSLSSSGSLSGTPAAAGTYSFTVSATDSFSYAGSRSYTWTINPAAPIAGAVSATVAASSSNNPITLNLTGGTAATVAVATSASHGTATASGTNITYTPTSGYSGSDSFTYSATNAGGTSSPATVSITVTPPTITISPTSIPIGTAGTAYSQTLTSSGGLSPYSYAVSTGALPSGVTLSNNGTLSGTPATSGSYAFTVVSTDDNLYTGARSYSWTVNPAAPLASAVSASITSNTSNNAITLSLSGGTAASVAVATAAGHGTATASGTSITYTPTSGYSGADSFTYTATNVTGTSAPATVTVAVGAPTIVLGPATIPVATAGTASSQAITASGGTAPYTYAVSIGSLPAGVALSGSGALSGTPLTAGAYTFTVQATDSNANTGTRAYAWTVNPAAPIAGAVSVTVNANSTVNAITPSLSGGAATSVAIASAASHGTAVATGTAISYTPAAGYNGTDSFTYTATNVSGTSASATVTVTVSAVTLTLSPSTLAVGTVGTAYSVPITTSGGTPGYTYGIASGALPAGVTLNAGTLSGTPTAAGTYAFTILATDSSTNTGSRAYAWIVNPAAPTVGNIAVTVPSNTSGNAIALSLGGGIATSVAVASAATHGSAVANGTTIVYTPTAGYSGPDSFSYTATNVSGTSTPATVTVTVSAVALTLTPTTLVAGTVGTAYTQVLTTSGGTPAYAYTVIAGSLPAGISLAPAGTLSGTPTAVGTYAFTVLATDSSSNTGSRAYTLNVNPAAPIAGAVATTVASNSIANAVALALTGGPATSVAIAGVPSHGTAVASGTSIAYTPTAGYSGADSFTYTATNAGGTSAPATVSVTVSAVTLTVSPSSLSVGIVGSAASVALTAIGGAAPYSYGISTGSLPAGVTLASDGTLAGTPVTAGTYAFTVVATDSHGNIGSRAYTWSVTPALPIAGAVGVTVVANSGSNPVALALSGGAATSVAVATAPAHGTATASGTTIGYAPAAGYSGSDSFTYTATNATGTSASATVSVTVTPVVLTLSPSTLQVATVGTAFSQAFTTTGSASASTYRVVGMLPAGLTLTSAGVLSGVPTTSGTYGFTVVATDAATNTGSHAYSMIVNAAAPAPPAVVQTVASNASRTPIRLQLAGTGALSVVVQTQPTHGVAVVQGLDLLYTPAPNYTGADTLTYAVTTPAGTSDPATVAVTVSPLAITIAPSSLPTVQPSRAVGVALQASGGVAPYQFAMAGGALPPGVALSTAGMLSGNPTTDGRYAFTVIATDAGGVVQSRDYTMSVARIDRPDPSVQADVIGVVFAQIAATERFTDTLLDNVGRHLDQVDWTPDLCADLVAVGTSAAVATPPAAPGVFSSEDARATRRNAAPVESLSCAQHGLPVWVAGTLQHGHASPTGNVGNGFSTSGVAVGVDLPAPAWLTWGVALDYGRDRTDGEGLASVNRAHSLLVSLYGRVKPVSWLFVDGVVGGGRLAFSSRRPGDLSGDRDGTSWFGSIRVGNDFRYDAARLITYLRADFKAARLDAFSESGSSDAALTYQAMRWTSHAVTAGLRGSWDFPVSAGVLSPGIDTSFRHTGANQQVQRLFYTDLGASSQTYDLATSAVPQSTTTVVAGLKLRSRAGPVYAVEVGRSSGSTGLRQTGARASIQFGF